MNMPSLVRPFSVLLLAGALLLPALQAADATLVADTYISAGAPAGNFGAATSIAIATGNAGLVQFDLTSIPASSVVPVAYLKVYVSKVTTGGTLTFSQALSAWGEAVVTFPGPVVAPAFASTPVSTGNSFVLVDVTALVNGWLADPGTNFGIEIAGTGATALLLDTRENTATSHPATLEVTVTGPQGTAGSPGVAGAPGAIGPAGPTGASGAKGVTGASGSAGAAGAAGATGPTGQPGATGASGAVGLSGANGLPGATGPSGPLGAAGPTGATGPVGASGPIGATGASGPKGLTGAAGATGPAGPSGTQGTNGPTGNQFNFDTTVHPSGFTVPDTDTSIYYLVNNPPGGGAATLILPHASVKGRILYAIPANVSPASNRVTIAVQAGDSIFTGTLAAAQASFTSQRPISLFSDGGTHWHIISTQ